VLGAKFKVLGKGLQSITGLAAMAAAAAMAKMGIAANMVIGL